MSNLAEQIREALAMFARSGTEPALIGGLAVVAHGVVRATQDVDFLVELEAADLVHDALLDLGYQCVYRSKDAANYVRATQGLDLLYAHRPLARRLLSQASERESPMGRIRIISVEGLNTSPYLTNQNFSMNSSYKNNAEPVSAINLPIASAVLAREAGLPFQIPIGDMAGIDPIAEWLSLMEVVQMLCPVWPVRDSPIKGHHFLL